MLPLPGVRTQDEANKSTSTELDEVPVGDSGFRLLGNYPCLPPTAEKIAWNTEVRSHETSFTYVRVVLMAGLVTWLESLLSSIGSRGALIRERRTSRAPCGQYNE